MKKKIAIIILTIAVFVTSIVSSVFAAVKDDKPVSSTQTVNSVGLGGETVEKGTTTDGWKYVVYSDGTAGICGYEGTETTATFPKTVNGHKIILITPYMLDDSTIEKLIIPDTIPFAKEVYTNHYLDNCFSGTTNLKEVVIGSMFARELPYCMFHNCEKLERVTFTEKFTEVASTIYTPGDEFNIERTGCYINNFAFGHCPELHNIVIPEGVTRVHIEAFGNSENIDTIVAPTSLVSVNNSDGDPDDETRCPAPLGVKRLIILGTKTKAFRCTGIEIIGPKDSYIEKQMIANEFELIDITTIDVQKIIDEINGVEPVTETTTSTATNTTTNTTTSTSTSTATSTTTSAPTSTKPSTTTTTVPVSTRPSTTKVPATKVPTTTAPANTTTPTTRYAGSFSTTLYVARSINNYHMNGEGIRYKSTNPNIATVNRNGKITAKSKGEAIIKITNNTTKTYMYVKVTVKKPTINRTNLTLKKNKKFKLKITGQVGTAKFLTNNKSVAKVNKRGIITAQKKGKATITIKTNGLTFKCKVTVK
ncbi:MAG: leucine-rich repeat protein [Ruminococcus sp.]|nr:leucine-rich repeat protein [Ruminococcus sp.]MCI5616958.1 leucine-rich repeat protein [Ruminococcus sp.]